MVKIQLTDVNDNAPVFLPREYNVSLRPNTPPNTPVVVVVATDRDSGRYAEVTYAIAAGNEAGAFRIDAKSGELFVSRADLLQAATHRLNVSATDGGGLRSPVDAQVSLTVVASDQRPPLFERPRYTYSVRENVPRLSAVGAVRAASGDAGNNTPKSFYFSFFSRLIRIEIPVREPLCAAEAGRRARSDKTHTSLLSLHFRVK
ncbi:hypothetical protein ONE63_004926 [Megalurothrips usitatus]|uniref:Cadherin domain-containing protein n=1 Tax=Megalurothrips usitatus TaxID=439358 RepID=A0AAV7X826_9NEOP|nr:hypothetical protein ONE63_004926 [Megalurothrips usitatus]